MATNRKVLVLSSLGLVRCTLGTEVAHKSRKLEACFTEVEWRNRAISDSFGKVFKRCGPELVCHRDHTGCAEFCEFDEECEGSPNFICDKTTYKCRHRGLFNAGRAGVDVGAALLFAFISGLALSAGIGGGGLYVPLLMLILGFSVHEATGLSQACLSGGASTALIYNLRQRHPSGNKSMIDYTLVLVMGPHLLIGALIGSTLNAAMPSWLILGLLMIVLCKSVWSTFKKAIATFRKENAGDVRGMRSKGDARLSNNVIERCLRFSRRNYNQAGTEQSADPSSASIEQPTLQDSVLDIDSGSLPTVAHNGACPAAVDGASFDSRGTPQVVGKPLESGSPPSSTSDVDPCKAAAGQVMPPAGPDSQAAGEVVQSRAASRPHTQAEAAEPTSPTPLGHDAIVLVLDSDSSATQTDGVSRQMRLQTQPLAGASPDRDKGWQRQYPRRRLLAFASIWLIMVVCIFMRGGKAMKGIVTYCRIGYWLVALGTMIALGLIGIQAARRAMTEAIMKPERAPDIEGELQWNIQTVRKVIAWSLLGGTLAALCGIGGGMIMGPILLELGFLPQVQSATTATTLFVMSTSTCLAFLVAGSAPVDYAFFLACATGLGAVFGKAMIGYLVKKLRRPSLIMFLLGGIIALSVVVMGITGLIDVVNDVRHGRDMGFQGFCQSEDDSTE